MVYKPGWSAHNHSLAEALDEGLSRDMALGYTHSGPHRADMHITVGGADAVHMLSTGQQKTFVGMLQITQVQWLIERAQRSPIVLIDDLPSELDGSARALLASKLTELKAQIFMTSVEEQGFAPFLRNQDYKMFHVEHGLGKVV
jgi:DNA replication and repair protein RecF